MGKGSKGRKCLGDPRTGGKCKLARDTSGTEITMNRPCEGAELENWRSGGKGQPLKIARVSSLRRSYPKLV